ncbi:unnamed protein product [Rotaria sp. Silwood1]|nr:unnamed protein product [Rotaria sp. Silwood1]CAF3451817.1 unnamed protein product [Rotaria sp. Silwood1]CAF4672804.1 unnamed protein product [Rotaria sp. Silwood1]
MLKEENDGRSPLTSSSSTSSSTASTPLQKKRRTSMARVEMDTPFNTCEDEPSRPRQLSSSSSSIDSEDDREFVVNEMCSHHDNK